MQSSTTMSDKKKALIAYRDKILQEIKYYDTRIDQVQNQGSKSSFYDSMDSSDSEDDLALSIQNSPSVAQLKQEQSMLKTCLQATQELTSLQVLQSEVNVLVEDPEIVGEPPVTEPGVWREVTAECRVDLVPFSISFFVHQPDRQFGSPAYRGLRVAPVKSAHEGELNRSVLATVTRPSDAVEVMKSYASAQRSRRSTLARLADKYPNTLYMEPMPDGGYVLKCANLLEVSWTLQNKWSPVSPFHHRMKFDLEYMDESYIKSITQVHRQLSDPSLDTDERTLLLAKIISTCLEAQVPTQELYESMSSDPEGTQSLKQRRTTLDREPEGPANISKDTKGEGRDGEVMAPPKTLPKRAKPKGKENIADNRKEKLKRTNTEEPTIENKKIKKDFKEQNVDNLTEKTKQQVNGKTSAKKLDKAEKNVASKDNTEAIKTSKDNAIDDMNKDKIESEIGDGPNNVPKVTDSDEKKKKNKSKGKRKDQDKASNENVASENNEQPNEFEIFNTNNQKDTLSSQNKAASKENKLQNRPVESNKNKDENKRGSNSESQNKVASVKNKQPKNKSSPTDQEKEMTQKDKFKQVATAESKKQGNSPYDEDTGNPAKTDKQVVASVKNKSNSDKKKSPTEKKQDLQNNANLNNVTIVKKKTNKRVTSPTDKDQNSATNDKQKIASTIKHVKEKSDLDKPAALKHSNTKGGKASNIEAKSKENNNKVLTEKNLEKDIIKSTNSNKLKDNKGDVNQVKNHQKKIQSVASTKKMTQPNRDEGNKERTVEKVTEKREAVKRKSNLVDRANGDVTSAKRKVSNNQQKDLTKNPNVAIPKTSTILDRVKEIDSATKKTGNTAQKQKEPNKMQKLIDKSKFKSKLLPVKSSVAGNTKAVTTGNTDKQDGGSATKIPKMSEALKKNPLRVSPRKIPSKFKTSIDSARFAPKTTNIPRLLKKPVPK